MVHSLEQSLLPLYQSLKPAKVLELLATALPLKDGQLVDVTAKLELLFQLLSETSLIGPCRSFANVLQGA